MKKCLQLIKKEALAQVSSCEFCEISKSTLLTEHGQVTASVFNKLRLELSLAKCIFATNTV